MMRRVPLATVAAALLAATPLALGAQTKPPLLGGVSIVAGAGGAFASSQPGFARSTGSAFTAGLELAHPWRSGIAGHLGFRVEGGFASQSLSASSSVVSGNVQTVHLDALVSFELHRQGAFRSYLLAGPVWARPSTKLVLAAGSTTIPGAAFEQTTHESVGGVLLGAGVGWRLHAATLRVEARWMSLATATKATHMVPVMLSVAIPIHP